MDRTPGAAASPLLREPAFLAVSFALGPPLIEEIARITRFSSAASGEGRSAGAQMNSALISNNYALISHLLCAKLRLT
jgi:hypothetical protein